MCGPIEIPKLTPLSGIELRTYESEAKALPNDHRHNTTLMFCKGLTLYQKTNLLDRSKLKVFADEKVNTAVIPLFDKIEKLVFQSLLP